jgi:hypothetical protein
MPRWAMAWGRSPLIGTPSKVIVPARGGVSPATERISVVLPIPFRPRSATI